MGEEFEELFNQEPAETDMKREYTPQQYFDYVKDKKNKVNNEELTKIYNNCLQLLNKYITTGQVKGAKKLIFHLDCIEKERQAIKLGIDCFVYRDDIEEYIDNIANDAVVIIELEKYEREIPDEITEAVAKAKDIFSAFYVVFTDYTGKVRKQVEKERRDKDPILFGTFEDKNSGTIIERFYFIGDWIDEYCDLTLDKMVGEMKANDKDILRTISTPLTLEELRAQVSALDDSSNGSFVLKKNIEELLVEKAEIKKKGFFHKVRTFFNKK